MLRELILPVETRMCDVRNFLMAIDNTLTYEVVPIQDPFGPTQTDPDLDVNKLTVINSIDIYATSR